MKLKNLKAWPADREQNLNNFNEWMVQQFGRELKPGDVLQPKQRPGLLLVISSPMMLDRTAGIMVADLHQDTTWMREFTKSKLKATKLIDANPAEVLAQFIRTAHIGNVLRFLQTYKKEVGSIAPFLTSENKELIVKSLLAHVKEKLSTEYGHIDLYQIPQWLTGIRVDMMKAIPELKTILQNIEKLSQ